ncbi:MBL fold metallo-hydrolase [Clostridiaceae bacterium 35-E11]
MFTLHHLTGNTYYIDTPTNIGLYQLNEQDCILIDTCFMGKSTERLIQTLEHHQLCVKAVLTTHAHLDHCGSNACIKEKYEAIVAAPPLESTFIEYPELSSILIFPSAPFSDMGEYLPKGISVDTLLDKEEFFIQDATFNIFPLKGHSLNQVGIVTPDQCIFIGDTFLSKETLDKEKMIYNYDIPLAIDSMKSLLDTSYNFYVPSHGIPLKQIEDTIHHNLNRIYETARQLKTLLSQKPLSLDQIMGILISEYGITAQTRQYYIAQACVTSFLSFLENKGEIKRFFQNGILTFKTVEL